jgi:SpoVK/Ycf46/Vps4 family AAA+-type ATPase
MKAETLKRLFRSIQLRPSPELLSVARSIVVEERRKGHAVLASELESVIGQAPVEGLPDTRTLPSPVSAQSLTPLPSGGRAAQPLLKEVPQAALRHLMTLPEAVEARFTRIEQEFVSRDRLAQHGLRPRQKILLYGPPGCGKSMGAERLAWTIGLPFYKVQFDSLISSFLGESATNLRTVFEAAKRQPCVLLLDECDFIAKSRSYGQDVGEMFRLVNMLLSLLEDFDAPGLLVATTNLENALDKALFRRFDDVLEVPRPGPQQVVQLLVTTLGGLRLQSPQYLTYFSEHLHGLSAAQIVKIARDAAKLCVMSHAREITAEHLEQAMRELSTIEND